MDFSVTTPPPAALAFGPATATLVQSVLQACRSDHTRQSYARGMIALDEFADGLPFTRHLLLDWRRAMDRDGKAVATINLRLSAVRRLVKEGRRARVISADDAAELLDVQGLAQRGTQSGTWLSAEQAAKLLATCNRKTRRGMRNYMVLAILLGCGLRREELCRLTIDHLREEDGRWIFKNIRGKGGVKRSVPLPPFVWDAVADWLVATRIRDGLLVRQLSLDPAGLSVSTILEIVNKTARKIGVADLSPHDLRRTCAKLCRKNGGELEQIQYLLGHASLVTTERYLGGKQNLTHAVNDSLNF